MKHNYFKHLFAVWLLLCSTVAMAHDFEVDGIYYNIIKKSDKTVEVTYKGDSYYSYSDEYTGTVSIPESVTYNGTSYSVTSIGSNAFYDCTGLTSITIPNSVTTIGRSAFEKCTGLTSIIIGNSVTSIESRAFEGCDGLTSIVVEEGNSKYDSRGNCNAIIETGSNMLIKGCKNTIIPNSVTSIGDYALYDCTGLTSITIPNSVTSIGRSAFYDCTGLTRVTIGNGVTTIGESAFIGCTGLTSITIPNSVTSIGSDAFYDCTGLTSITIPNSVTNIGNYAFENCTGLTSITIPNSVTSIGSDAFHNTAWYNNQPDGIVYAGKVLYKYKGAMPENTLIVINDGTLGIAGGAFSGCTGLTNIEIPNSVTNIGIYAFYGCTGLASIIIGNSVTSIGQSAFYGCTGLKTIIIFSNLTFSKGSKDNGYIAYYADKVINAPNGKIVGDFVFDKPNDANTLIAYIGNETELNLPADYNGENYVIGNYAFYNCTGFTSVTIPNCVTSIGNYAFYGCSDLETIYISNSIESIGDYAFAGCNNIFEIKAGSKKAITANENIFSSDAYNNAVLYVPTGRKFAYEKATPWSNFYILEMDFTGVEEITDNRVQSTDIYNLQGRKLEKVTQPGIYIINGKKTFIK